MRHAQFVGIKKPLSKNGRGCCAFANTGRPNPTCFSALAPFGVARIMARGALGLSIPEQHCEHAASPPKCQRGKPYGEHTDEELRRQRTEGQRHQQQELEGFGDHG